MLDNMDYISGDSKEKKTQDRPTREITCVDLSGDSQEPTKLRDKPGVQELWDSTVSKLTDPVCSENRVRLELVWQSLLWGARFQHGWSEPQVGI
jgi:hypothetical protein